MFLGPAVGAYLYDVGGFSLPFVICGSIDTILAMLLLLTIPTLNADSAPKVKEKEYGAQENNDSIEEGSHENSEKSTFVKECDTPRRTTDNVVDDIEQSVLGYIRRNTS